MISITTSELEFYQNKIYKLEMDLIVIQEQLLAIKQINNDQYKLKYQLLLDKMASQHDLKESRQNQLFALQQRNTRELNEKWENIISIKNSEFNNQIEGLKIQKNQLKNKIVQLQMKNISLQRQIDQGDIQILNIKLDSLKKQNERLKHDNNQLYNEQSEFNQRLERLLDQKEEEIKERQKSFYRQTIQHLEQELQKSRQILQKQKQKNSPNREASIEALLNEKVQLSKNQNQQLQKYILLLQKSNRELNQMRQYIQRKQEQYIEGLKQANDRSKGLQQALFERKHYQEMRIINLTNQMAEKRQKQSIDFRKQLEVIQKQFEKERQHNEISKKQYQDDNNRIKRQWEVQKAKYLDEKNNLKQKIAQLRQRIKSKQNQSNHNDTQNIVNSLMDLGINKQQFQTYQSTITFMSRQNKKAVMKLQEKDRQINYLLQELKNLQSENERQLQQIRDKNKKDQKKLFKKIVRLQEEADSQYQLVKQKEKENKQSLQDLQYQKNSRNIEVKNLKKIISEMQKDYQRLTSNKKNLEDSFRQQRQNVITTKLDINQQKKKKWVELQRQKTLMQIVYREREIKLTKQFEMKIQKLKYDRQQIVQSKERYRAQAQFLKQRLNLPNNQQKSGNIQEYQKKLATLDLQIALTQNLFETLSNATAQKSSDKNYKQLIEMSNQGFSGQNSLFQDKQSEVLTPYLGGHLNDDFRDAAFSFEPIRHKNHFKNKSK